MFTGTTTVSLASVPGVERVVTLEIEAYLEKHNRPYFEEAGVADKIDIRIGDGLTTLEALGKDGASFDMVRVLPVVLFGPHRFLTQIFVDADKPNYKNYFHRILDLDILAEGGFIVVDNSLYKAAPWVPTEMHPMGRDIHEFNQIVR